jgi:GNAT superfamily N-acetyltransferase
MIKSITNTQEHISLLEAFLNDAGTSLKTFRYFGKRPLDIIKNHKYTILLLNDNEVPVAYGHLDLSDDVIWLGICVSENHMGKGYGHLVMEDLLQKADSEGILEITLQVDKVNYIAVNLYKKFNFITSEEKDGLYLIMKRCKNGI